MPTTDCCAELPEPLPIPVVTRNTKALPMPCEVVHAICVSDTAVTVHVYWFAVGDDPYVTLTAEIELPKFNPKRYSHSHSTKNNTTTETKAET